MSPDPKFLAASKAAESWLNTVAVVAHLAQGGNVDLAYRLLMPTKDRSIRRNVLDDYQEHIEVLDQSRDQLAAQSESPVTWAHGRGWSGIARVPAAVYPHVWCSAHEAAAGIAQLALAMLVWPLEEITDPAEQRVLARHLLADRWKALVIPLEEVAALQERIRRERAKLQAWPRVGTSQIWISLADAERITTINRGVISRAIDAGELKHNGQKGKGKRKVEPAELSVWVLQRHRKAEQTESHEQVARQIKKHVKA
jgi:hypothetical protein